MEIMVIEQDQRPSLFISEAAQWKTDIIKGLKRLVTVGDEPG